MSLGEDSVVLEEREMLERCFHGEIRIWSRRKFYASLIYEQKSGAIRNYRKGTGQIQRAGVQN